MQLPLQISFRHMSGTEAIRAAVHESAARLDRFSQRIMGCRVVVDLPHRRHEHGNLYQVSIDLTLPGEELAVNRTPGQHITNKDLRLAIDEAFAAAVRLLEDYERRQRHDVKSHGEEARARVARLFPKAGYGFLNTPDGREIYFHQNSLVNAAFQRLQPGTEVSFVEEAGEQGPQASAVSVVGRHHQSRLRTTTSVR